MLKARPCLSFSDIEDTTSDIDIYRMLLGDVSTSKSILSPLREDDTRPSFRLYVSKSGKINWVDYGNQMSGGPFDLYRLLKPWVSTQDMLYDIYTNVGRSEMTLLRNNLKTKVRRYPELLVKIRRPDRTDAEIWRSWGILPETLKKFRVHPISLFWLDRQINVCRSRSYAYDLLKDWKVYRPFEDEMRFVSGGPTLQGFDLLPDKADTVVIHKSYKDVMLLSQANIPSFALQSESDTLSEDVFENIKDRFSNIIIWGDTDRAGRLFIERHTSKYGIKGITNDDDTKDPTDHAKKYGLESSYEMIKRLINEKQQNGRK
jgi:hypothetical protein